MKKKKEKNNEREYDQLSLFDTIGEVHLFDDKHSTQREEPTEPLQFEVDQSIGNENGSTSPGSLVIPRESNNSTQQGESNSGRGLLEESKHYQAETNESKRIDVGMDLSTRTLYNYYEDRPRESLTPKEKCENNIQALQLLRELELHDTYPTLEEQDILAKYTGWGGVPHIFNEQDKDFGMYRSQLKDLLSVEEYQQARSSVLTSFYTPTEVIDSIYQVIDKLGFKQGNILDPSMGVGGFFNRLPYDMQTSSLSGIELDTVSGKISNYLYPNASIHISGLEKTELPNNFFDLAITNVPFGNYKIHDLEWNTKNYDIHNYFFAKSMQKVRKGGLLAFITTTQTMDGKSSILQDLHEQAKLIGAYRLPSKTFMLNGANTEVVSDVIIMQKLEEYEVNYDESWLNKVQLENRYYNQYFKDNPQMVLGAMHEKLNQYGKPEITVVNTLDKLKEQLSSIANEFPSDIYKQAEDKEYSSNEKPLSANHLSLKTGEFFIENNRVCQRQSEIIELINDTDKNIERLRGMIKLSTLATRLINVQVEGIDDISYEVLRLEFNQEYDSFVKRCGYLSSRVNNKLFADDPNSYLLYSLENINSKTKEVSKTDFFYKRTIKPNIEIKSVDSIEDALSLSLNKNGQLDFDYMAELFSKDRDSIINELVEMQKIFYDPFTEEYQLDEEYLSGNVRERLTSLKAFNDKFGGYDKNIEALERVLPKWIDAADIKAQLGSPFIPAEFIRDFGRMVFKFDCDEESKAKSWSQYNRFNVVYSETQGQWILDTWSEYVNTVILEEWGVAEVEGLPNHYSQPTYNGFHLFDDCLNSKLPTIYDYWEEYDGDKTRKRSRVNPTRTAVARDLQDKMFSMFEEWLYEDIERRETIESIYNTKFNSKKNREYDGSFLTFPQMNSTLQLEPYQKNAVARGIFSKTILLSQVVGAGKTFEMVAQGMEMKRLGIRNKILYVVPNHLVGQWGSDFKLLYPNANILVATKKDFQKENRNIFYHKIATNDFDAIIMAHSSFKLIPMSVEYQEQHLNEEITMLTSAIEELESNDHSSMNTKQVKMLERSKKSIEANIQKLADIPRDDGITFDQLGIDYVFVDEAHEFKNLYVYSQMSNVAGVPQVKSQKASDMYMKTQFVQDNGGGVGFATGTPISNTMAELYTMQRYLQKSSLEELGIRCFDAWAKTFGKVVSSFEISVDGSGFQTKQRFNKFFNVAELMNSFREVAEIMTKPMLSEALLNSTNGRKNAVPPTHIGGKPKVISIEPTTELEDYISKVVERTEDIHNGHVDPRDDNMLKVTTDSKKASIDMRLLNEDYGELKNTKLNYVVDEVYRIYKEYESNKATQLIFCDSSTPKENQFNVYDELKNKLIAYGVKENEIAFIHDANTELQKNALFEEMNKGSKRILLGSTAKLGAGTNVQERLIAIHHVDVPWRASDIEQRNGRGFRQGNMFDEIYELRYVTKKSFDAYSWQMIETKSTYMNQLLSSSDGVREMSEDDSATLSYAEVKAIASGNPLIKEKLEIDTTIKRLDTLKNQFLKKKFKAESEILVLPSKIEKQQERVDILSLDLENATQNGYEESKLDEHFSAVIGNTNYNDMKLAGDTMLEKISTLDRTPGQEHIIGKFCNFEIGVTYSPTFDWQLCLIGQKRIYQIDTINQVGRVNFYRLIKKVNEIPLYYNRESEKLNSYQSNLIELKKVVQSEFSDEIQLQTLKSRQKEIDNMLDVNNKDKDKETIEELEI